MRQHAKPPFRLGQRVRVPDGRVGSVLMFTGYYITEDGLVAPSKVGVLLEKFSEEYRIESIEAFAEAGQDASTV